MIEKTIDLFNFSKIKSECIYQMADYNMFKYDFNNCEQDIVVDDIKNNNNNNNGISSLTNISKEHETSINNNDIISNKNEKEEESKKYKITNMGQNLMKLPENYSTDDEDEYKFINLMNESNDSYELAVDSKKIKVYAKIVS